MKQRMRQGLQFHANVTRNSDHHLAPAAHVGFLLGRDLLFNPNFEFPVYRESPILAVSPRSQLPFGFPGPEGTRHKVSPERSLSRSLSLLIKLSRVGSSRLSVTSNPIEPLDRSGEQNSPGCHLPVELSPRARGTAGRGPTPLNPHTNPAQPLPHHS